MLPSDELRSELKATTCSRAARTAALRTCVIGDQMPSGATLQIENLTKAYGPLTVVDRVSLSVKAGEFVTLLGASGSGKTTTLMMIAGLTDLDSGSIRIDGRDIAPLPPERRGLGVVFQSYALFPNYNVYENIAFPLRLRRMLAQATNPPATSVTRKRCRSESGAGECK